MSHMKRTIDVEIQDELLTLDDFDFDMTVGELPDVSHWPAIKHLIHATYMRANSDAWTIAGLVDDTRYMGAARGRIKAAESALREAVRELHMALGDLG